MVEYQFPVHDGVPRAHQCRPLCLADRGRTLRRGVPFCPRSESDGERLRTRLRASLRDCMPAWPNRPADCHSGAQAFSHRAPRSRVASSGGAHYASGGKTPLQGRRDWRGSGWPVGGARPGGDGLLGHNLRSVAGRMLYLGIPEYRLPRNVVEAQVREILETGDITLRLNSAAGRDFTVGELRHQGFDAVLIAVGAHRSRDLSIPGVDLDGVHRGIEFLLNVNLGYKFTIGKKVLVIGGGNVAMDVARSAAREVLRQQPLPGEITPSEENVQAVAAHEMVDISLSALRMGAREVGLVCLEKRDEMPAALEEIEEAETEGIMMHPGFGPKRVLGHDGKVVGLECVKTKYVFDENHRFSPVFYDNSETEFDCDTVILAIGQAPNLEFLRPEDGVQVSPRGLVNVNRETLMTSAPGVFAGGDCAFGPRLIIDSVGDGKRAAVGIDEYLRGTKHPEPQIEVQVLDRWQMAVDYMNI